MSTGTLGGLNNDVAASKLDSGIFAAHIDAELSALIHLHQRAIAQAKHGVSAAGGAGTFALGQFVTDFERLLTVHSHAEESAVERFHPRPHAGRTTEVPALSKICR